MEKLTSGTVIAAAKQWWLKVNTKAVKLHPGDGAIFPYIIKVTYTVEGKEYTKRKWINPGKSVPAKGSHVNVFYQEENPSRARVEL